MYQNYIVLCLHHPYDTSGPVTTTIMYVIRFEPCPRTTNYHLGQTSFRRKIWYLLYHIGLEKVGWFTSQKQTNKHYNETAQSNLKKMDRKTI